MELDTNCYDCTEFEITFDCTTDIVIVRGGGEKLRCALSELKIVRFLYETQQRTDKKKLESIGWERAVSPRSLPVAIGNLRRIFKAIVGDVDVIATFKGYGYQWIAPPEVVIRFIDTKFDPLDLDIVRNGSEINSILSVILSRTRILFKFGKLFFAGILVTLLMYFIHICYLWRWDSALTAVRLTDRRVIISADFGKIDKVRKIIADLNITSQPVERWSWESFEEFLENEENSILILSEETGGYILDCLSHKSVNSYISLSNNQILEVIRNLNNECLNNEDKK